MILKLDLKLLFMSQTKLELEAKLQAVTEFMGSLVYRDYLLELEAQAEGLRVSILSRPPYTDQERAEVMKLHGQLELVSSETPFETMRTALKAELSKLAQSDTLVTQDENTE